LILIVYVISFIENLDISFFYFINHLRSPFLDKILPIFSLPNFLYLIYFLSTLLILFKIGFKRYLLFSLILIIGFLSSDFICSQFAKPFFKRKRPFLTRKNIYYYSRNNFQFLKKPIKKQCVFSFPSGHATLSGYTSSFLSFEFPKASPLWITFALIVGWSRIYLGHHYPLDIIGGYILGLFCAIIFYKIYIYINKKLYEK